MCDGRLRLALLSPLEIDACLRSMTVNPGCLDQDMPAVTVASLGHRPESFPVTATVLIKDKPEMVGELLPPLEAHGPTRKGN